MYVLVSFIPRTILKIKLTSLKKKILESRKLFEELHNFDISKKIQLQSKTIHVILRQTVCYVNTDPELKKLIQMNLTKNLTYKFSCDSSVQ